MSEEKKYPVEYACDDRGDHKAPMYECVNSNIKEFDSPEEAYYFADECSYVYNINEVYGNTKIKQNSNPVLDAIQNQPL